jgi:double-stranded uracil-DNA glycosylase
VSDVLPDVLAPGLKVIFCGCAVGDKSARVGAYYAGPGNKFWGVLFRVGLTPRQLDPHEFRSVLRYGLGLTDIVKTRFGRDHTLQPSDFQPERLLGSIRQYAPRVLAFNGKRSAREFYGRAVSYGRQPQDVGPTAAFVFPSTSGAAWRFWDESYWQELADFVARD